MPRNNRQNRRMVITVATIICLAVFGLVVINVDPVGADRLAEQIQKHPQDAPVQAASGDQAATSGISEGVAGGVTDDGTDAATDATTDAVQAAEPLQAETKVAANPQSVSSVIPDSDVTGAIVKMVSALVIVIAAVYLGLYLLKKSMGKKYAGSSRGALEVLQTTYVGPHKALSLVRVAERSVLVGVTDSQISTITELTAEETERICGAVESGSADKTDSFARLLSMAGDKLKSISLVRKQAALDKVVDTRA